MGLQSQTRLSNRTELNDLRVTSKTNGASLVAQQVKNPPEMQETWVQSLGWKDPLGERNGYPLQYSGLENSMDCVVHEVAKRLH